MGLVVLKDITGSEVRGGGIDDLDEDRFEGFDAAVNVFIRFPGLKMED